MVIRPMVDVDPQIVIWLVTHKALLVMVPAALNTAGVVMDPTTVGLAARPAVRGTQLERIPSTLLPQ